MSGAQPLYCETSVWCVGVREGQRVFTVSEAASIQPRRTAARIWFLSILSAICTEEGFTYQIFMPYKSFRKPGSLSDPHRLRAEKPGAGIDFHLPAQQTEPGGGKKRLLPQ